MTLTILNTKISKHVLHVMPDNIFYSASLVWDKNDRYISTIDRTNKDTQESMPIDHKVYGLIDRDKAIDRHFSFTARWIKNNMD